MSRRPILARLAARVRRVLVVVALCISAVASVIGDVAADARAEDALDRLTATKLAAVRKSIDELRLLRQLVERPAGLREFRANLHVHSAFSHDSRGTVDEIVAAAKKVGTQIVMFTEHPAAHYDFFVDGHQGVRDGVLLIPGAEMKGLLVYSRQSVRGSESAEVQAFSDLVRRGGGLTFVSHLEERMDWQLRGVTGVEIYNTHADIKDEKRMLASLRNPLWLLSAASLYREYPAESFAALQDYPADYLRKWDELCRVAPHTGVSANDAHQNIGLIVRRTDGNKARVEDALGQKLLELDAAALGPLLPKNKPEADPAVPADQPKKEKGKDESVLFELRLDPYEQSLRYVGTHLLMKELSQVAVWEALEAGRAFVGFDWLGDTTGFDLAVITPAVRHEPAQRHELGAKLTYRADLQLVGCSPLPVHWRLVRDGAVVAEHDGREWRRGLEQAGVYRVEAWLDVAGQRRPWVLANPFYIAAPK